MKKKYVCGVCLALLLAGMLTGCGKSSGGTDAEDDASG